uniref:Uncharacterized protein n=1 Tax=Clastoptera arizonana TaxID=38151 RepID=A0A1B6E8J7_9HEMI
MNFMQSSTVFSDYRCEALCREICPPCIQECFYACEHKKCTKECGQLCDPCLEECTRQCVHQKCSMKCNEICNIEVCTEKCTQNLDCGHQCDKLCEEVCLPCRTCNFNVDGGFIRLEDCGCTVNVKDFKWFKPIGLLYCPNCRTPIIKTKYFKKQILKLFKYFKFIKKLVIIQHIEITKKDYFISYLTKISYLQSRPLEGFLKLVVQRLTRRKVNWMNDTMNFSISVIGELLYFANLSDISWMDRLIQILKNKIDYINHYDIEQLATLFPRFKENLTRSLENTLSLDGVWSVCIKCDNPVSSWEGKPFSCQECLKIARDQRRCNTTKQVRGRARFNRM